MLTVEDVMVRKSTKTRAPLPADGTSRGFSEHGQASLTGQPVANAASAVAPQDHNHTGGERHLLKLGPDGRVLIPSDLRKAMRLRDGDTLVATLGPDGELRLWGTDVGLDKMRALVAPYMPEGSAVDAFLKERGSLWGED